MIALSCPHCQDAESIVRFGFNRSGTERCRCKACGRTFTLNGRPTGLSADKEAAIAGALAERISQRGIARMLNTSRHTIRAIRKKEQNA